ncbi:MAG: RNA-guided endonuclease InsQ/TnpB family protein, partial [Spirulina sp.]
VDRSFRSFFNLIKAAQQGNYRFEQISIPRYLKKEGYFPLIMPRIKVKEGFFEVPMSREFRTQYGSIRIPFPKRLEGKKLKEVRIHPKCGVQWFEVELITEEPEEPQDVSTDNAMAIDLGLDNLATCVTTTGASFIVDGKKIKSINQWFNKLNSQYQSQKDLQGIKGITNRQGRLLRHRNNQVRDYLSKSARLIINKCISEKIGVLVVGVNPGWKQEISMGKRNNQNFVQIPHYSLRQKLSALCQRYGIEYREQEESYTSQASALDQDKIPTYNANSTTKHSFSGKRVKRGLYRSQAGHLINADCNGATNIGRKSKHEGFARVSSGLLASPLRISIS